MLSAAERRLDRNLPLLNYYSMLRGCLFILPVLAPFVHDRLRLDFFHLMLSEAIFAAAVVICEVPPGWLADVWRRVDVLRVSACLSLAAVILIWVADGFWVFALGQVVMGISISLQSGADSALLYDSLQACARATRFLPLEARRGGLALVVTALAALVGGLLYQLNPLLLWAADSIAAAAAIAIACFLTEPPRQRLSGHSRAFPKVFRAVAESFQTAPLLYGLIVAIAAVFAVTKIVLFLTQAFYMAYALPLAWFGPLAAGFFAVSALGGFLASWVRERLSLGKFFDIVAVAAGADDDWCCRHRSLAGAAIVVFGRLDFWYRTACWRDRNKPSGILGIPCHGAVDRRTDLPNKLHCGGTDGWICRQPVGPDLGFGGDGAYLLTLWTRCGMAGLSSKPP